MASVSLVTAPAGGLRPPAWQRFVPKTARAKRGVCATKEISMLAAFFLITLIGATVCLITGAIDDEQSG
jgi:hypothetical protein